VTDRQLALVSPLDYWYLYLYQCTGTCTCRRGSLRCATSERCYPIS